MTIPPSSSWGASGIWSVSATRATRSRKSESPGETVPASTSAGSADGPATRVVGELAGDRHQLGEVLQAGAVLGVVGGLELVEVARAREHGLQHHVGALPRLDHRLELLDERDEALDGHQRPGDEPGCLVGAAEALPEGDPLALGVRRHALHRAVADAALGDVEDPAQRDLVVGVDQHPQVGQRVADLAALVEAHPADDAVGHAEADEDLLEHPRLRVGAVEDGDVAGPRAGVGERVDLTGDEPRLVALVVGDVADDPGAVAGVGPQVLRLAALVVADHGVRGVEDGLGRAVVLLEQDRGGVREVLLEVEDVADVGAAEGVDRLVGVTDDHQLGGRRSARPSWPRPLRRAGSSSESAQSWWIRAYCAWLVSWYSSTSTWRKRRR